MDSLYLFAILLLGGSVAFVATRVIFSHSQRPNVARVGIDPGLFGQRLAAAKKDFFSRGYRIVEDAYFGMADPTYLVQTQDMERVIISPKYIPELEMLPETKISHRTALVDRWIGTYTGMDIVNQSHVHNDVCRTQLTRNIPILIPGLSKQLDIAMPAFFSAATGKEFAQFPVVGFSYAMISQVSAYILVSSLASNKEWVKSVVSYSQDINKLASDLRPYIPIARPIVAPFLKSQKSFTAHQKAIRAMLDPIIEARRSGKEKGNDILQYFLNSAGPHESDNQSLMLKLMFLTTAATHTSALAVAHAILDLCTMPEYLDALREEATECIKATDGQWTNDTLKMMRKMDSFMKESQRVNHPAALGFHRKVESEVTLSSGVVLPKGTLISAPAEAQTKDPQYYVDPEKFDGYRFYHQDPNAYKPEDEYANIQPGHLAWGRGRSTCPGRWYAGAQIKLLLGRFVVDYDFKLPEGQLTRPPNPHIDEKILPDMKQTFMVRKR